MLSAWKRSVYTMPEDRLRKELRFWEQQKDKDAPKYVEFIKEEMRRRGLSQ
jgi:hypothetical protein